MKRTQNDIDVCPICGAEFIRWRLRVPQLTCGKRTCIDRSVAIRRSAAARRFREEVSTREWEVAENG